MNHSKLPVDLVNLEILYYFLTLLNNKVIIHSLFYFNLNRNNNIFILPLINI